MHRLIRTQIDFYCTAEIAEDAEFFYGTQIYPAHAGQAMNTPVRFPEPTGQGRYFSFFTADSPDMPVQEQWRAGIAEDARLFYFIQDLPDLLGLLFCLDHFHGKI